MNNLRGLICHKIQPNPTQPNQTYRSKHTHTSHNIYIYIYIYIYSYLYIYHIYPTLPLGQDMIQGQFLSRV